MAVLLGGLAGPPAVERLTAEVQGGAGSAASELVDSASYPPFLVAPTVRFEEVTRPRNRETQPGRLGGAARPSSALGPAPPERLVVPRLGVDAPVVGIAASSQVLVPPDDPQTLGWWTGGAQPGARLGGVLIAGHAVSSGGGAFDDLASLRPGDRVRVRTGEGVVRYAVSAVTVYRKASLARAAEQIFGQAVPHRLVLVTCEDWNGTEYLSNAVVLADPLPGP